MQESVLKAFPNAMISVSMVWIPMLHEDTMMVAEQAAQSMVDARVQHFFDSERTVGKAIAYGLSGKDGIAWDTYLFYLSDAGWKSRPPVPQYWIHQLTKSAWADRAHYHYGNELVRELGLYMKELGFVVD